MWLKLEGKQNNKIQHMMCVCGLTCSPSESRWPVNTEPNPPLPSREPQRYWLQNGSFTERENTETVSCGREDGTFYRSKQEKPTDLAALKDVLFLLLVYCLMPFVCASVNKNKNLYWSPRLGKVVKSSIKTLVSGPWVKNIIHTQLAEWGRRKRNSRVTKREGNVV